MHKHHSVNIPEGGHIPRAARRAAEHADRKKGTRDRRNNLRAFRSLSRWYGETPLVARAVQRAKDRKISTAANAVWQKRRAEMEAFLHRQ